MTVAAAGLALFPHTVAADYFSAMERCVKEATSAARMACVDTVSREDEAKKRKGNSKPLRSGGGGGGGEGSAPAAPPKVWEYVMRAETQIEGSSSTYRPTVVFRCTEGETYGYVIVGMAVEPDRVSHSAVYTDVIVQVDQERAFRMELRVSQDGRRLYIPSSIDFSNTVSGKNRLTLQVTPHDSELAETVFDVQHFEEGIAPLRKACQW